MSESLHDHLVSEFETAWESESEKDVSLKTLQLLLGSVDSNLHTHRGGLFASCPVWGQSKVDIPEDQDIDSLHFERRSSTDDDLSSMGTYTTPCTPQTPSDDSGSFHSLPSIVRMQSSGTSTTATTDDSQVSLVEGEDGESRVSLARGCHTTVHRLEKLKLLLKKEEFKLTWLLNTFTDDAEHANAVRKSSNLRMAQCDLNVQSAEDQALRTAKQHQRRKLIVEEILETEKNYIDALDTLLKVYKRPIEITANTNNPILPEKYYSTIFFRIEEIMNLHLLLKDQITQRLDSWSDEQKIGDVFVQLQTMYQAYLEFTNNYSKALSIIRLSRTEYPTFASFCDDLALRLKSNRKRHNLNDLMVMPIQRIPRYLLLLETLHKNTPKEHSDNVDISSAIKAAREIAQYINEGQRRAESVEKVYRMDQRIAGFTQPLFSAERYHILEQKIVDYIDRKRRWTLLILLNDHIVCAKKVSNVSKSKETQYKHLWSSSLANVVLSKGSSTDIRYDKVLVMNLHNDIKMLQKEISSGAPVKTNTLDRMRMMTSMSTDTFKDTQQQSRKRELALLKDSLALNAPQNQLNVEIMCKKNSKSKKTSRYTFLMHTTDEVTQWVERVMNLQCQLGGKSQSDVCLLSPGLDEKKKSLGKTFSSPNTLSSPSQL